MRKKRALFALITFLLLLAALEAGSRLLLSRIPIWNRLPGQDDFTYKMRWTERHCSNTPIYYSFDAHHPRRGWTVQPALRDVPLPWDERLNSNSRGLRGLREVPYDKPPGVKRMIVLGDSFTFGDEVSDDETIPAYLEARLPGWEVLNMGVHGYGHDQMLLYFEEEGVKYQPDVVLLVFVNMDIDRNMLRFRDYLKPKFELADGKLILTNTPIPLPEETLRRHRIGPRFFDLVQILYNAYSWQKKLPSLATHTTAMERMTAAIMTRLLDGIAAAGARPLWMFLPVPHEIEDFDGRARLDDLYFMEFCAAQGIPSVSLMPYFAIHSQAVLAEANKGDTHWLAPVNQMIAERLVQDVARRYPGLLD